MAEIINLRSVRKGKARAEKEAKAEDNRIAFGRPEEGQDPGRGQEGHRVLAATRATSSWDRDSDG